MVSFLPGTRQQPECLMTGPGHGSATRRPVRLRALIADWLGVDPVLSPDPMSCKKVVSK